MAPAEMELEHLSKGKAVRRTQANAGLQAGWMDGRMDRGSIMDRGTE